MERINPAVAPLDAETLDLRHRPASDGSTDEVRGLAEYELWLVGGGDDNPVW